MKRQTAWVGFYKAMKEIQECERIVKAEGHDCSVRTRRSMAEKRAYKYAKALVMEHGWRDKHTEKFIKVV